MYNPQVTGLDHSRIKTLRIPTKNSILSPRCTATVASNTLTNSTKSESIESQVTVMDVSNVYFPDMINSTDDFRDFLKTFQPLANKKSEVHEQSVKLRKSAFKDCDSKRSGRICMADIEKFIHSRLKQEHGPKVGDRIFVLFLPTYVLAYDTTKVFKRRISDGDGDFIGFQHFRILNMYFCVFAGMLEAFSRIIGDGDKNRGMTQKQWIEKREKLTGTGFIALERNYKNPDENDFNNMISDEKGLVNFQRFRQWIIEAEISAQTTLGGQFSMSRETLQVDDCSSLQSEVSLAQATLTALMKETRRQHEKLRSIRMNSQKPLYVSFVENTVSGMETEPIQVQQNRIRRQSLKKMASDIRTEQNDSLRKLGNQVKDEREDVDPAVRNKKKKKVSISKSAKRLDGRPQRNLKTSALVVGDMVSSFRIPSHETGFVKEIRALSEDARLSLRDFSDHLQILNKTALDEEGFNTILDDMGYSRDRTGLFEGLLEEVSSINPVRLSDSLKKKEITFDDMLALYMSESYHLLDNGNETGDQLMEYIDDIFNELDVDDNGFLEKSEISLVLHKLIGRPPTEEQVSALYDVLDTDKSESIDREEFKFIVLNPNKNQDMDIPESFNYNLFDPALVGTDDFVAELENYCLSHDAVEHHFLQNIAGAAFGKAQTLDILVKFFAAYSHFNCSFISSVETLIGLLDKKAHKEILEDNLKEEMGHYDEETLLELESLGVSRESVEEIPHNELFREMVDRLERRIRCSYRDFVPDNLLSIQRDAMVDVTVDGKIGRLSALYFGSELIVPKLYGKLLKGLQNSCDVSNEDVRFLLLHIDMDDNHAKNLREIVVDNCNTIEERIKMFKNADKILRARVRFYDAMRVQYDFSDTVSTVKAFYDKQANRWSRDTPSFLEDFTSIPAVFDMCKEHVKGSTIIDVGCGEGYAMRRMKSMGARKLIGVDMSERMIELARNSASEEHYIVGDAVDLKRTLLSHSAELNLMLGAQFDVGVFDLAVAIQLLNEITIADMNRTMKQVYSLLKPGGSFVFSVPHPSQEQRSEGYFSLRDKQLEGISKKVKGEGIDSRNYYKIFEDYINAAKACGFNLVDLKETRVSPADLLDNPDFFSDFIDRPLFLVIKVRKPNSVSRSATINNASSVDLLPKKLTWNRTMLNNFPHVAQVILPEDANIEVCQAALKCYDRGLTADTVEIGRDVDPLVFKALKPFCKRIRTKLLHQTGAVIVKGLSMDKLGGAENIEKMTACSKIAYYLICGHIGSVDGGARGRLFDVKDSHLNATDTKNDNVLFSVSDSEAGWHTDGASKDRVYDVVGLMCITPAAKGGKFRFANACNVYNDIAKVMPKFLMYEMTRPIPRDVLENGKGLGSMSVGHVMGRTSDVLALRIRYNSYPIYVSDGDRMRFRYMRHWIETGHMKTGWKVPTFLRVAMDVLDDKLDEACVFHDALGRGDIIFANNAMLAHARDPFKNAPGQPPRHKVRAWLQIQKADILSLESEDVEKDLKEILHDDVVANRHRMMNYGRHKNK